MAYSNSIVFSSILKRSLKFKIMQRYSLFCGDAYACSVFYKAEIVGVLSLKEQTEIRDLAYQSEGYAKYRESHNAFVGTGFLTIKLDYQL